MRYISNWEKWLKDKKREQILKKLEELHSVIEVDELTSIYNLRAFKRELNFSIANFKRFGAQFCVVNIDLKKFKSINDSLGHRAGDRALQFFAKFLQKEIRETDLAFRVGGDEFAVILNHSDKKAADFFLLRLNNHLKVLKDSLPEDSIGKLVTPSYATLQWSKRDNIHKFLERLDAKMFEQKRAR